MNTYAKSNVKSQYSVVIVIINWNGKEDTALCLESIRNLNSKDFHVVVVDNNSNDGSTAYFKNVFPEITLIENKKNIGLPRAFNLGIEKSLNMNAEYILCLNNDTILDPNFLDELVKVGEVYDKIGVLCPKEYNYFEPDKIVYAGGDMGLIRGKIRGFGEIDNGQFNSVGETNMLCGSAMMFKSSALIKVGFFDPDYFVDWEDKDIAIRFIKSGYKLVFCPNAKFWHKRRGSTQGSVTPLSAFFGVRNGLLFASKHYTLWEKFIFLFGCMFIIIPFFLIRSNKKTGTIKSILMALKSYLSPESMPDDEEIVELLK